MTRKLLYSDRCYTPFLFFLNILFSHASDVNSYDLSYALLGKRQKKTQFLVSLSFSSISLVKCVFAGDA